MMSFPRTAVLRSSVVSLLLLGCVTRSETDTRSRARNLSGTEAADSSTEPEGVAELAPRCDPSDAQYWDQTREGIFHGHVRDLSDLPNEARKMLKVWFGI
jgi:hypothetical protein